MKVDAHTLDDHQVKLTVELDNDTFDNAKRRAARKLARRTKIPGFRPGKAPYQIIVRHLGEGPIIEEAIEITVEDIYPKVIEEAEIEPYGPGKLEDIPELDPPTFEFIIPLRATVELGDYHSIRIPYELPEVTDEDVDNVVQNLRDQQAVIEPVERIAEEGDVVNIRLSGKRTDASEDDQDSRLEDSLFLEDRPTQVLIESEGESDSEEWPFPGFSRQLIGKSAGDELIISHTFGEDISFESLQGANVEFTAIVEDVRSRTLPEADDEFAKSFGEYETFDDLRSTIRQNLEDQASEQYDEEYNESVIEQIVDSSTIKYPPQMLENEIDNVIAHLESRLAAQGLDIDLYLKTRDIDVDGLREESQPVAESRIMRSLVLLEISEEENIRVDPDELQTEAARTLDEASRFLDKKEMRKLSARDATSNLVGNIMMDMIINKTQDRIREIARGMEEDVVPEEASNEIEIQASEEGEDTASELLPEENEDNKTTEPVQEVSDKGTEETD